MNAESFKHELASQSEQLIDQIKDNTRLRIGLWLVLGIVLSFPLQLLHTYNTSLRVELDKLLIKEAKVARTANEEVWMQRMDSVESIIEVIHNGVAEAPTLGVAKATFQQQLGEWAKASGLERPKIQMDNPVLTEVEGLYRAAAKVDAKFEQAAMQAFLHSVERSQIKVVVERLDVDQRGLFRAFLVTYFTVAEVSGN